MRRRFFPLLAAALVASGLALGGCGPIGWTRVTVNHPFQAQDVAFVVPRQTTWDEVTRRLGAPDELIRTGDGLAADYFSADSRSFRVNFGWPLGFIAPVSYAPHDFTLGAQGIGTRTFQVAFDAQGVVVHAGFIPGAPASQYRLWPFSGPGP
jgi:hypothetical protein